MATIVKYSAEQQPYNAYPKRIVSPPSPGPCCVKHMERVGKIEWEKGFPYYYRRCRVCGFTVKHLLPVEPVEVDLGRLLEMFQERHSPSRAHAPRRPRRRPGKSSPFAMDMTSRSRLKGKAHGL